MIVLRMWTTLLPILLLQLLIPATVNAGHPEWEHARFILPEWISIKPVEPWSRLWPDKTVKLCYESEATWRRYHPYYHSAMRLWYANGLPEDFKVREVGRDACRNTPHEQLLIKDTPDMFATDVGLTSMGYINGREYPNPERPRMYVSWYHKDTDKYRVSTIAHELAHAFGMQHEHQNPYFWMDGGKQVFIFDCEALEEYDEWKEEMSDDEIWGSEGICTNFKEADHLGMASANYLPLPFDEIMSPVGTWATKASVDWDSIMLYGSYTGAKKDEEGKGKEAVLLTADMNVYPEPEIPSADDVNGLKLLYNTVYGAPLRILFNDPRSPSFSTFRRYAGCST
ncbi:hypothetical protein AbraIFM66950_005846 [Aspergillus brasiliensis]|nr:hypothetical protein AbraIFM66950_005846 [Aspergillus brasiliensis]